MQGIGDGADKLYRLERSRNEIIKEAAKEHGKILGFDSDQFWTHSLPEQIAATLESFDKQASEIAAIAWLERRGYTVTKGAE